VSQVFVPENTQKRECFARGCDGRPSVVAPMDIPVRGLDEFDNCVQDGLNTRPTLALAIAKTRHILTFFGS
jgi:hypothetical protein